MATLTLTDEQLLQACMDDAFLESLLARGHSESPAKDSPLTLARRFRDAIRSFVAWLGAEGSASSVEATALWIQMFHHGARVDIEELTNVGLFEEAAQFSAACQAVCARLSALREGVPSAASWQEIITAHPQPLEHVMPFNGASSLTVKATSNSLRRREDGGVDIVEHCLGSAEATEEDLIRFSIRAWLLKQSPHALRAHGVIEGYAPENDDVVMSSIEAEPQHLDEVFEHSVRPVLAALAG
jgi:hypothetical protein